MFQMVFTKNEKILKIFLALTFVLFFINSFSIINFHTNDGQLEIVSENINNDLNKINTLSLLFEGSKRISNTGLNSTHTRISYNPLSQNITVSWVDLFQPNTPSAISSIYCNIGNKNDSWFPANALSVTSVLDTMTIGYNPNSDMNNTIHILFDEFLINNYDIRDVSIKDGILQPESTIVSNSGNSSCPVTIFDNKGLVHLAWIDTTDNANGDLYYTFYNATDDSWDTPFTRITNGADIIEDSPPAFTIDNNNTLHLIWADNRTGDQELYYSYLDEGSSWSTEEKITNVPYAPINPRVSYDNITKDIQLIFRDNGATNNLYYSKAKTKFTGGMWSTPISLTNYLAAQSDYDVCTDNLGHTIVVFERYANYRNNIYLMHKHSNTTNWGNLQLVSSSLNVIAHDPSITVDDTGTFYIAYAEIYQGSTTEIYIKYGQIDSDEDGLSDLDEINIYFTNPNDSDSDNDTLSDGDEALVYYTDPNDIDSDNDQIPDDYEIEFNLDPNNSADAELDNDNDNLTNLEEYNEGTDPYLSDTDGDSLLDGDEVKDYLTNPLEADSDSDGLFDGYEVFYGLNPLSFDDISADPDEDGLNTGFEQSIWTNATDSDTDDDGFNDGVEVSYGTDPLDPNDYPDINQPRDYRNLIIGILTGVGVIILFLLLTFVIAKQFRPTERGKRKELQRTEKELFTKQSAKSKSMIYETKEQKIMESEIKKKQEKISVSTEEKQKLVEVAEKEEPSKKIDPKILKSKREDMKKAIDALKNYEDKLTNLLKKDMTPDIINTTSREGLTEFASDSQTLYSEAKTIWTSTILPLIKGYEEELHMETLEVEKIIDNCSKTSDKILDVLVSREMELVEEEAKKEAIKKLAQQALEKEPKEKSEKKDMNEEEKDKEEN